MSYAPQELLDLYLLARNVIWRQRLDDYEDKALGTLLAATDKARRETIREVERRAARETAYSDDRAMRLLRELEDLTLGVRAQLTDDIADIAAVAGEASFAEHRSILTLDGRASVPFNDVSLSAGQLRQLLVETPVGGRMLREWVDGAFSERTQRAIQGDILAGVLKGEGYRGLSSRLEEGFNLARRDAITLARSYVQTANVSAQEATYRANGDVVKELKWCATLENGYKASGRGTCLACAALDGKKWTLDAKHPPIPLHPRCLTPETPVFAPDKIAAFVAPYSGPVFEVGLSNGARFTVTPDHLFLTRDGFTPAKLLREGVNVFHDPTAKVIISGDPNDDRNPSAIKDVVEALAKAPGMSTVRVPVAPEDFHGDGEFVQGYIDIVAPDSLLRGDIKSFLAEHGDKFGLSRSDVPAIPFAAFGDALDPLLWLRLATDGGMSGESVSEVFLRRAREHHQAVGLSDAPGANSGLLKSAPDDVSRDTVPGRDGFFRLTSSIGGCDVRNRKFHPLEHLGLPVDGLDPVPFERASDSGDMNSELLSEFSRRFPGQISFADVLFCRETYFSGHVYDLQTFSSLYYVGGAVSSNCRCVLLPVTVSWRDLGINLDELEEVARPYTKRPDQNIDAGGRRTIIEVGQHQGDYASWFTKQGAAFQEQALGPGRFDLLKSGRVGFGDLVDESGRLRTLKELEASRAS